MLAGPQRPQQTALVKASCLAALAALLLAGGCATRPRTPDGGGAATVRFLHPERFLDFEDATPAPNAWQRPAAEMERFLQQQARAVLPAGRTLEMTVTDVDLPGRIHRGGRPVRIVDARHGAEVRFDYRLLDAHGRVLREGSERLVRNPAQGSVSTQFDPSGQRVIHEAIGQWMRRLAKETSRTPTP